MLELGRGSTRPEQSRTEQPLQGAPRMQERVWCRAGVRPPAAQRQQRAPTGAQTGQPRPPWSGQLGAKASRAGRPSCAPGNRRGDFYPKGHQEDFQGYETAWFHVHTQYHSETVFMRPQQLGPFILKTPVRKAEKI